MPYVSRVLGPENLGLVAFSSAIVQNFVLVSNFGTSIYGVREVAYSKHDKEKLSRTFLQILFVKAVATVISLTAYFTYVFIEDKIPKTVLVLQSLSIVSALADVSWFFQGIEDFKTLTTRNILTRVIFIALMFLLVHEPSDVLNYISLLNLSNLLSSAVLIPYAATLIKFDAALFRVKRIATGIKEHILASFKFFVLLTTIQAYTYLDKVILGFLTDQASVAFYDLAQKIIRMPLAITTSISAVMMPVTSSMISQDKVDEAREVTLKSLAVAVTVSIPMVFGILAVSKAFVAFFLGTDYEKVISLMYLLSPILIIVPIGNIIGIQLMIPLGRENLVIISPTLGAVTSIVTNFLLIPRIGVIGACISSVLAEFVGTFATYVFMRKHLNTVYLVKKTYKSIISSIIMFLAISPLSRLMQNFALEVVLKVGFGVLIFTVSEFLLKDNTFTELFMELVKKIRSRLYGQKG